MKITRSQLRRIIKEERSKLLREAHHEAPPEEGKPLHGYGQINYPPGYPPGPEAPTGRVEVEWDFELDDDDAWNELSYEEQEAEAGIPPVINIPPDVMADYQADAKEYGASQAEDLITDYLSEMHGWLHQGWSWV